jgi:hypothetical protein
MYRCVWKCAWSVKSNVVDISNTKVVYPPLLNLLAGDDDARAVLMMCAEKDADVQNSTSARSTSTSATTSAVVSADPWPQQFYDRLLAMVKTELRPGLTSDGDVFSHTDVNHAQNWASIFSKSTSE